MNDQQRAAMQQALYALKLSTPEPRTTDDDYTERGWKEHSAAITALRAALEEQADPKLRYDGLYEYAAQHRLNYNDLCRVVRAALAEPVQEQEPVAWRSENANPPGGYVIFQQYPQALADLGKPIQPLYTAPPQRKPLTDEELSKIIDTQIGFNSCVGWEEDFARAIERAHGIGEQE